MARLGEGRLCQADFGWAKGPGAAVAPASCRLPRSDMFELPTYRCTMCQISFCLKLVSQNVCFPSCHNVSCVYIQRFVSRTQCCAASVLQAVNQCCCAAFQQCSFCSTAHPTALARHMTVLLHMLLFILQQLLSSFYRAGWVVQQLSCL